MGKDEAGEGWKQKSGQDREQKVSWHNKIVIDRLVFGGKIFFKKELIEKGNYENDQTRS